MGRRRTNAAGLGKKASESVQAYCAKVQAEMDAKHAEHVHQTRVKLAFERLARDYPRLNAARLWMMAHATLRMGQGTMHAGYREARFIAE